jgi:hypothetical protein
MNIHRKINIFNISPYEYSSQDKYFLPPVLKFKKDRLLKQI